MLRRSISLAVRQNGRVCRSLAPTLTRNFAEKGEEGTIPGIEKQVQGLEKLEIDAMKAGKESPFQQSGPLSGPFGTPENPVKVPSSYSNRIVGCVGGTGESAHDLLWHEVRENDTTICLSCGQAFTLEKVE